MNFYELVTPHDPIMFAADSDKVAVAAALLVAPGGHYGVRNASGEIVLPILLLASEEDTLGFLKLTFGSTRVAAWIDANSAACQNALRTFRVARSPQELAGILMLPGDAQWRLQDERRSSLHDPCRRAKELAEILAEVPDGGRG